jgi:fructose-bisphosphate aldolase class II
MKLKEYLENAARDKVALGHFNVAELTVAKAIAQAGKELGVPVIIGTSEGERDFLGLREAVSLVRALREEYGIPVFLNADHTHSFEKVKEAVDAGYDAVIFDGVKLPFEENVRITKQVVEYAKSKNPDIIVEAELGNIGTGSEVRKELPLGAAIRPEDLTKPEEAEHFVRETGIDLLAPAVGNIHGMFANAPDPALDIPRAHEIRRMAGVPLVLHGGSGNTREDFLGMIDAGAVIVHISTEVRVAWREGLEMGLRAQPDEVSPYKLLAQAQEEAYKVILEKIRLFSKK